MEEFGFEMNSQNLNQIDIDEILAEHGLEQDVHAKTALLVDRAKFVRKLQELYLQEKQIEVIGEAGTGIEAIQKYAELKPDLIIIGVHLPDLDGIEVTKNLLKYDKYAQIFICSGDSRRSTVIKAVQTGALDYLLKPFSQKRLLNHLVGE